MAEPKKNTLKNTVKEDTEQKNPSKDIKPKKDKTAVADSGENSFVQKINSFFAFLQNERFQKIFGLTLLLLSVYLCIAFTSFALTWQVDQDKVLGNLFSPEVNVQNWLGKFGALLSYVFIHKWFGAASYIFAFVAFITGLRIAFNVSFFNITKVYLYSFFFLIFSSITLGYIFNDSLFYLGGAFGFTMSSKLNGLLGYIGTGVLLVFTFVVFLVAAFNISLDLSNLFLNRKLMKQKRK
jgi:DNA segregation ATPase FtsK/SpoIIIE, S-DNA-T family